LLCEKDPDCIAIKDACNGWEAVRKDQKASMEKYYADHPAKCDTTVEHPEPPAECFKKHCHLNYE
jgi:hypothetical protein